MIIATDLLSRGRELKRAWITDTNGKGIQFVCKCGEAFILNRKNKFISEDQYACPDCKRVERLTPLIGERNIYKRIRYDAKKMGRDFEIGFDWFVTVCHEPCHYCGECEGNNANVPSKIPGKTLISNFRYNGLDRIDNNKGYIESNCVPCCIICNRAKNSMAYEDFTVWLDSVVKYRSSIIL